MPIEPSYKLYDLLAPRRTPLAAIARDISSNHLSHQDDGFDNDLAASFEVHDVFENGSPPLPRQRTPEALL